MPLRGWSVSRRQRELDRPDGGRRRSSGANVGTGAAWTGWADTVFGFVGSEFSASIQRDSGASPACRPTWRQHGVPAPMSNLTGMR